MTRYTTDENCTLQLSGDTIDCLNLGERVSRTIQLLLTSDSWRGPCVGSYNYLGFADDWHLSCKKEVLASLNEWPVSMSASRTETGSTALHDELEKTVARSVVVLAVCLAYLAHHEMTQVPW
jgi:hypothetical protein